MAATSVNLYDRLLNDYIGQVSGAGITGVGYADAPGWLREILGPVGPQTATPEQKAAAVQAIQQNDPGRYGQLMTQYGSSYGAGRSSISGSGADATLNYDFGGGQNDWLAPVGMIAAYGAGTLSNLAAGASDVGYVNSFDSGAMQNVFNNGNGAAFSGTGFQGVGADAIYGDVATGGGNGYFDFVPPEGGPLSSADMGAPYSAGSGLLNGTALGRVLDGTAKAADYASVLGGGLGIASSLYGASLAGKIRSPNLPAISTLSGLSSGAGGVSVGAPPLSAITGGASTVGGVPGGAVSLAGVDPWGDIGGRVLAGNQLKTLLTDPSSITSMPDYEAGMQAVERSLASQGYQGSGNMMAALQKYGGQFYNQAVSRLSGLSGASQDPAIAAKLALQQQQTGVQARGQDLNYILGQGAQQVASQGQQMQYALGGAKLNTDAQIEAAKLSSQALGSAGYGVQSLFGNGGVQLTPGVLKLLQGG